jgi:site-specific DNA-methyltransferase (adenine-specific)
MKLIATFPSEGHVLHLDALEFLRNVSDESADLVFLDPPFNIGKAYGARRKGSDILPEDAYSDYMTRVLDECCRVLKPGAALYLYHLPSRGIQFGAHLQKSLDFRHWIAVSMKNGFARGNRLYPAHYALLYFTKGAPAVFHRPKVQPMKCRHCDGYIRDYGGYLSHVQDGINLSDVWDDLSPVRHQKYKTRAANELPVKMLQRVVSISGAEGGVLLDPFAGAGTSAIAARAAGMRYLLNDRDMRTVRGIVARLSGPCEHGNGG